MLKTMYCMLFRLNTRRVEIVWYGRATPEKKKHVGRRASGQRARRDRVSSGRRREQVSSLHVAVRAVPLTAPTDAKGQAGRLQQEPQRQ